MRLQEVRKARDMTQAEFAKKLGVSQASISDWENGKKTPSLKTFIRAGTVLECSLDYLAGRSDKNILPDAG